MRTILFAMLSFTLFIVSCSNDADVIELDNRTNDVSINISLQNFYSCYNFYDTKHNVDINEVYRVFNSEYNFLIQTRTLFYNDNGILTDSLITYSSNTNAVNKTIKLAAGQYTAVTTVTFCPSNEKDPKSWVLHDKQDLSTVWMECKGNGWAFAIMSYDAKTITIKEGQTAKLKMTPEPIGALTYLFCQNFSYKDESSYPKKADNNIRSICVYGRNVAIGYYLDPQATEKYIYKDDGGNYYWWALSNKIVPQDYSTTWFQDDIYDCFYILAPEAHIVFGYILAGKKNFESFGEAKYSIQSGKTYMAYWDFFKVGNPYFGLADNNHWNSYSEAPREMIITK